MDASLYANNVQDVKDYIDALREQEVSEGNDILDILKEVNWSEALLWNESKSFRTGLLQLSQTC